jgi:nucleotide-binding universal stress UspA family protein
LVGVAGSELGSFAVGGRTRRAERSDEEVVALLSWTFFDQGYRPPGEDLRPAFDDDDAKRVLAEAVEAAGVTGPVTQQTVQDPAPEAIVDAAEPHDLIVVGARGLGGFKGLLLGSVSNRVLELARCPVVVIHGEPAIVPDGEIVVGVDGSEESLVALRWAAAEATATGAPVRIVHAWQVPIYAEMATPEVLTAIEEAAAKVVAGAAEDPALAGVTVARDVACDGAAHALLAHDVDASMLVVATRGHGALKRLLLGSTSRQVAQHATSPVVVVPGKR